ncbi:aspartokinase [Haematococcus lacustris]|uniref:aspartate kinase n=1 Tax=Haematococcus lacustris TaxID=44745 RepID=A0A6A0A3V8_HAELA|nr:aspartokinase [Haematococcus lacustris]
MSKVLVTSIVLKPNVTLVDIISTRMMGQYGFLATVFEAFRVHKLSVDVVATSEKLPDIESELGQLKLDLDKIATVSYRRTLAIVSLICNVQRTSRILENVFDVLDSCGINVVMMSQGASKTNISLVVEGADGQKAVLALHKRFFEDSSHV